MNTIKTVLLYYSSSGNTSNGDKCNSTGVTSIAQRPDDSQKDTLASKTEYTRIYPDLSNRYAEPHDFLIGDNFAMSDNIALVAGPDNESPKRNGRVVSGGKKLIENESNKNEHITPEKQVDESHLTTHQLTFEQQNGFVTNTGIDDPNYRENPEILLENHTQIKNESAISEDPPNETDNGNIEVDELFYTRQDDSYSIDKFEQSTDEGGQSSNSSRNSFDTVVNIGKQENAIKPETRFIEPIIDKYPEECSNQNDKKTYNMDVSESFDRNNSSPSQQTINSHQIIVSPVQDTERINVEQVHQDTIDSELAELAKV